MTATILNFRPATVTPLHAAPREPEAKSYFFSGGSLHFNAGGRGIHLEPDQAMRLRLLYAQQAAEAYEAREIGVARRAAKLWGELGEALDGLADYCRATGRKPPEPSAEAASAELHAALRASLASLSTTPDPAA